MELENLDPQQDFNTAWKEEEGKVNPTSDDGAAEDKTVKEDTSKEEVPKEDASVDTSVIEPADESGVKDEEPNKEPNKEPDKDDVYDKLLHKHKTLEGMYNSKDRKVRELEEQIQKLSEDFNNLTAEPTKSGPIEEDPELNAYLSEYSVVAENEAKLRKRDIEDSIKRSMETITKELDAKLSIVNKLAEDRNEEIYNRHVKEIEEAHPDWNKTFTKTDIDLWIDEMPPVFQESYRFVANNGTTADVIKLFGQYKKEKGLVSEKSGQEKVVNRAKQKELRDMETIKTKRGPVSGKTDLGRTDFDGAWNEAVRTV